MSVRILVGDCRERVRGLPDRSMHCVVTSPPYFGLRDYGTGRWHGGDPDCKHRSPTMRDGRNENRAKLAGSEATNGQQLLLAHNAPCGKCGAVKVDDQIGLEPTPDQFVSAMVEVFREVRRVLRDDGTLWLNIGDSFNAAGRSGHGTRVGVKQGTNRASAAGQDRCHPNVDHLKQKDLIGIPWLLAFALRADGWFLRQDIIWHKPNPMPESVEDRCTKAHEYLFLLTKQPRYFYDALAIAEPSSPNSHGGKAIEGGPKQAALGQQVGGRMGLVPETRNKRDVWTVGSESFDLEFCTACQRSYDSTEHRALKRRKDEDDRSVVTCRCGADDAWLSHFATFPPALIVDCIKAGCPARCCAECGAPEVREVNRTPAKITRSERTHSKGRTRSSCPMTEPARTETTGFVRTCSCDAALAPGVVLDPFGGAGTTGMVANREHRDAVLLELNPHYAEMTRQRIIRDGGMLARVEVS